MTIIIHSMRPFVQIGENDPVLLFLLTRLRYYEIADTFLFIKQGDTMKSYGNMFLLLCATIFSISEIKSTEAENHNPITKIVEHTNSDPCVCNGSVQLGARFKPRYNAGTFTSAILSNTQVGYKASAMQSYTPESTKIVPHTFGNLCGGKYKWLIHVDGESFTGESITVISASTSGTFIIPGGGPVPANVSISGNASPYNTGDTVTLTANTTTTLPPVSYIWRNPIGQAVFTTKTITFTADAATAGLWTVEVYTDNQQVICSASVTTNIVVTPPCDLMISATGECNGLVYVSGTGAQAEQTVTIYAGLQPLSPTLTASDGSFSGTVGILAPGMYTITAQTATPCTSNGVNVTVNPNPTVIITSNPQFVCQGESVMVIAPAGFVSYQWFINGVLSPETSNILIDHPPVNSATSYFVTVTDSNGCHGTSNTLTVFVNPNPVVSITGNMDICGENPPTLTAMPNDTSTYSYLWSIELGSGSGGASTARATRRWLRACRPAH